MRKASFHASQFKMVLLGESAVGKSSLALRFAKGRYNDNSESTIGAAFITHTLQIDNETSVRVELWDTAGQERYHSLAPMYYRGAQAALVVYDITNTDSFRRAKMWVRELRQVNGNEIIIGLAGNKADIATGVQRQINTRETMDYAEENSLIFYETSAKRGDNVMEMFISIAKQVLEKQAANQSNKIDDIVQPKNSKDKKTSRCCASDQKNEKKI